MFGRFKQKLIDDELARIDQHIVTTEIARDSMQKMVDFLQIDSFTQLEHALTYMDKAITNLKGLPVESDPILCNIDLERCLVSYDASQQKFNIKPQY